MIRNGAGVHQWNVQLERAIKVFYVSFEVLVCQE
jgi:hypothetical protein